MNSHIITNFLHQIFSKIKKNNNKQIKLIIDNSPLHKTFIIKKLMFKYKIEVYFILPYNPFLNLIEYCFCHIKK